MSTSEYLQQDIKRIQHSTRVAKAVGVVLTLIVLFYCIIGVWYVNIFTNPQTLANFAIGRFQEEAPKVIASTEMKLIENAPSAVNKLSLWIQGQIPQLRVKTEAGVDKFFKNKVEELQTSSDKILDAYFESHSNDFAPKAKNESIEAYATRVANILADEFGKNINEDLKKATGKDVYDLNSSSKKVLSTFLKRADKLANSRFSDLNREEQLERLLIAHVINHYLSGNPKK